MKCPICKQEAEQIEPGFFDGFALKCPTHSEFEFTDSVRATKLNAPREDWERALKKARMRAIKEADTLGGKRPRIFDEDFL